MRLSLSALLLIATPILALTNQAGSPADAPNPLPGGTEAQSPQSTPPVVKEQTLFDGLYRLAKASLVGGTVVNTELRNSEDIRDGVGRVTDEDWDAKAAASDPDDIWVLIIHGSPNEVISKRYLDTHMNATLLAKEALAKKADLTEPENEIFKRVHWARMDYMTEANTCTKWLVTRPPFIVIATNKGQTLRFLKPRQFPAKGEVLFGFIKSGNWEEVPIWDSSFAPGGKRAHWAQYYINFTTKLSAIPKVAWIGITGAISQLVMSYFHNRDSGAEAAREREREEAARVARTAIKPTTTTTAAPVAQTSSTGSKGQSSSTATSNKTPRKRK